MMESTKYCLNSSYFSLDLGCDVVPKDESDMDRGGYTLHYDFESREVSRNDRFIFQSIIDPNLVNHKGFAFTIDSCGLDKKYNS